MNLLRLAAFGAVPVLLGGCLDPVYNPESVYDPEPLIAGEDLNAYDTVRLTLIPLNPNEPPQVLFRGPPGERPRLPLYHSRDSQRFEIKMEAWKEPVGLCFIARFNGEYRKVDLSQCNAPDTFALYPKVLVLYVGGETGLVTRIVGRVWDDPANAFKIMDTSVATIDSNGVVTPRAEGNTFVYAGRGTLSDSVEVRVVGDAPKLRVEEDTTVIVNSEISHTVLVEQHYGGVKAFKWDWENDGIWDDSLKGFPSTQTVFKTPKRLYDVVGDHRVAFYVRDGEGNETRSYRNVYVADFPFPAVSGASPSASPHPTWTWHGQNEPQDFRVCLSQGDCDPATIIPVGSDTSFTSKDSLPDGRWILYVQQNKGDGTWSVAGAISVVVTHGPIARYTMDSVGVYGRLRDSGLNNAEGSPSHAYSDSDRHGDTAGAVRFDGRGMASVGFTSYPAGPRVTITAWVKTAAVDSGPQYFLYAPDGGFRAFVGPGGKTCGLEILDPDSNRAYVDIAPEQWTFFAASFDGEDIIVYKDAQYVKSVHHPGSITGSLAGLLIGGPPEDLGFRYHGTLDDVRIYNRALDGADIQSIYSGGD